MASNPEICWEVFSLYLAATSVAMRILKTLDLNFARLAKRCLWKWKNIKTISRDIRRWVRINFNYVACHLPASSLSAGRWLGNWIRAASLLVSDSSWNIHKHYTIMLTISVIDFYIFIWKCGCEIHEYFQKQHSFFVREQSFASVLQEILTI